MIKTLLSAVTTNVTGSAFDVNSRGPNGAKTGQVQVQIAGGTGTVTIEGKIKKSGSVWGTVAVFTASQVAEIVLFPQMRAVVSGISGATITTELYAQ